MTTRVPAVWVVVAIVTFAACACSGSQRPAPSPPGDEPCSFAQTRVHVARMSGAGGHECFAIQFANAGPQPCRARGYPSIAFVDRTGRQVGKPAARIEIGFPDSGDPISQVEIGPGQTAHSVLRLDDPGVPSPEDCHRAKPSAMRVRLSGWSRSQVLSASPVGAMCRLERTAVAPLRSGSTPT